MITSPLADKPLLGIRVVCHAVYVPAPVAASRLQALGARITRVEPPAGDPLAQWSPDWYAALRAGQRLLRLDIKATRQRATFDHLLARADLLLTALRPAALERLGLTWEELHRRFPSLSHVAITGYAAPDGDEPGHDLTYQARAGLATPPHLPRTLFADLAGAERAVSAALALLLARARGGGTGHATVSLAESVDAFAAPLRHGLTGPGAVLGGAHPGYDFYRASDGWLAVAALEPHFWAALLHGLALHEKSGRADVARALATESAAHWVAWARQRGIPVVIASAGEPSIPAEHRLPAL